MKDGTGPRGFGLRDGLGPHGRGFRKTIKNTIPRTGTGIKGTVGKAVLTTCANVGLIVAGKVVDQIAQNGTDGIKDFFENKTTRNIENKNDNKKVIVVNSIKNDDSDNKE